MSAVLGKLGLQAFLKILMQQITRVMLLRISYSGFPAVLMVVCCGSLLLTVLTNLQTGQNCFKTPIFADRI